MDKESAVLDDQSRVVLMAAHAQLVIACGHELMNQQNGVQMNGHLIRTLVEQRRNGSAVDAPALIKATDRIMTESRRSVEMFSNLRTLALALTPDADGHDDLAGFFVVAVVLPALCQASCGTLAGKVELECEDDVTANGAFLVGMAGLLCWLAREETGQIDVQVGKDAIDLQWEPTSSRSGEAQRAILEDPPLHLPLASALLHWQHSSGRDVEIEEKAQSISLSIAHGGLVG